MANENENKLVAFLGFDPAQPPKVTQDLLNSVLEELQADRTAKAKEQAKTLAKSAVDLRERMDKARKDFAKQEAAFKKEEGKLLGAITRLLKGGDETEGAASSPEAS